MQIDWIYIAISVTALLSGISVAFIKYTYSIDIIQFKVNIKNERISVLRNMVKSFANNNDTQEIEKILEKANATLKEFDMTENSIKDSSQLLMYSIYTSIIGFALIASAGIVHPDSVYPTLLLLGGFAYFGTILFLIIGISKFDEVQKKYNEMMIKSKLEEKKGINTV